jgi:hypothetical protein
MFTRDFSRAPAAAQAGAAFFGGTRFSGPLALVRLAWHWRRIVRAMRRSPGYLDHVVWFRWPSTFGNLSLWRSQDELFAFARSPEHRDAVAWLVTPGTADAAFIRFLSSGPAGHTLGAWRAEADGDAWRSPTLPFSERTPS